LERLRERVKSPESPGRSEPWQRAKKALDTVHSLILEHGDEIDRDYKERITRGENHKSALVAAQREALGKTEEGHEAWAMLEAVVERGGEDRKL
jgi:hypothetical protein